MFLHKFKIIVCCLLIVLLNGCAQGVRFLNSTEPMETAELSGSRECGMRDKPEEKLKLQIIQQLMDSGKLHAALAHLDATGIKSPQETYLRAEILRKTGRADLATPLYNHLIHGCAAGNAYHGLGLIAGRNQKIDQALSYLEKARAELPTDVRVRNDLGYALFLDKRYESASHEFLTALELDEANEFSVSNLVLLLLVTEQYQKAQSLAVRMKLSGEMFKQLLAQARKIKEPAGLPQPSDRKSPFELGGRDPEEEDGPVLKFRKSGSPRMPVESSGLNAKADEAAAESAESNHTAHLVKNTETLEEPAGSSHSRQP
jgi:Flp pilus assembly protein TadD